MKCIEAKSVLKGTHYLSTGYGLTERVAQGKRVYRKSSHRHVWEECFGPIPKGMCVCHHCDNPKCVNPAHLFLGSPNDNMQDMIRKGRKVVAKGERHGSSKLSRQDVIEIRKSAEKGHALSVKFGVSESTISHIRSGKGWCHL